MKGNYVEVGGPADRQGQVDQRSTTTRRREVKLTVDSELRPAARGHDRRDPRAVAVGHRKPLRRAPARPEQTATKIDDGGTIPADNTQSPVDLDQLFNTLDPKTRKGSRTSSRVGRSSTRARPLAGQPGLQLLRPGLLRPRPGRRELALRPGRVPALRARDTLERGERARRALDDLAALVGNANTTAKAIGDENVALAQALAAAPGHAAPREHDLRQPARDARRPRRARQRVEAGDEGPRAVPRGAAPAGPRSRARRSRPAPADPPAPGPNNDLIDLTASSRSSRTSAKTDFPRTSRRSRSRCR